MRPIEELLADAAQQFRGRSLPVEVLSEARKRVLDSFGCFFGAFNEKAVRALRSTFALLGTGPCILWGLENRSLPSTAAWLNGAGVRALDYNDTYLSKEPCHPSDMISSLWAACELSGRSDQGRLLLHAMVLSYDIMCRLCDATSLRTRGWDHVTYLPIATAVGCSYILALTPVQTRNAIALSTIGNNALRQTRVGTISDWKAACAAYAAQAGLNAALLAKQNFTGPHDIFSGKHGFFAQVSGVFELPLKNFGQPWKIMETHTKFFPAEHHAQSAIEAALEIRGRMMNPHPDPLPQGERENDNLVFKQRFPLPSRERARVRALASIQKITVDVFEVGAAIIGSEKEKWRPTTRETADHSLPYLVSVALLEGNVTLRQYQTERYLKADVRKLMKIVRVRHHKPYDRLYPKQMPTRVTITLRNGKTIASEIIRPHGYAGRPMSWNAVVEKFQRLSTVLSDRSRKKIVLRVAELDRVKRLASLHSMLRVGS
jgi:2-methylcitrate dehydratase